MSVITAGGKALAADAGRLAVLVAVTSVVFWLAHVHAQGLEHHLGADRRIRRRQIRDVMRDESAVALAGVAPVAALLLAPLGIVQDRTAIWWALGVGVAVLAVQGVRYGRLERLAPGLTAAVVAINVAIGLALVVLKAALTH